MIDLVPIMQVAEVFQIKGRGCVVTGLLNDGCDANIGDKVTLLDAQGALETEIVGVEGFSKRGEDIRFNVIGLLVRGLHRDDVRKGMLVMGRDDG